MKNLALMLVFVPSLLGQGIGFGVKAGVPLSDAFKTSSFGGRSFFSENNRYTVGPAFEVRLPMRLAVELDVLYRSANYRSTVAGIGGVGTAAETTGSAWQVPLLLKYKLNEGLAQPYLAGGIAFQRLTGLAQVTNLIRTDSPSELLRRSNGGFVLGAGLEIRALLLRISPEIRYTRWANDTFRDTITGGDLLRSNRNQAEFLVGFTF